MHTFGGVDKNVVVDNDAYELPLDNSDAGYEEQ